MDLKCRKLVCKYNNHYTCMAKNIAIATDLSCDSYAKDHDKKVKDVSRCMFEETPSYAPHREKKSMRVACKAECLFNDQGVCIANGLTLNALNETPCCLTHINP